MQINTWKIGYKKLDLSIRLIGEENTRKIQTTNLFDLAPV